MDTTEGRQVVRAAEDPFVPDVGLGAEGVGWREAAVLLQEIRDLGEGLGVRHRCTRKADALCITADAGGSNGYRTRGWKAALQRLADDLILLCWRD